MGEGECLSSYRHGTQKVKMEATLQEDDRHPRDPTLAPPATTRSFVRRKWTVQATPESSLVCVPREIPDTGHLSVRTNGCV